MGKVAAEGKVKLYYLPAAASVAAPTVANVAAGTNLTPYLPTSGLNIDPTQNNASIPMMDDGFVIEAIGTESVGITLTLTRDSVSADDDAWTLFVRGLTGYLLVSRFGSPIAGSRVEVYPIEAHDPTPMAPAENEFQQFQVRLAVNASPNRKAVVAA